MDEKKMTRREVLGKALLGVVGVVVAPLLPHLRKETKREKFLKSIPDQEASYYKKLAG